MTTLVLTVVGVDRAGIVSTVAEAISAHGGNWENSELAELSGIFAGVIQVEVAPSRADELRDALSVLEPLASIVVVTPGRPLVSRSELAIRVMGNDRVGIVREVTSALGRRGANVVRMTTQTQDAAMSGGRLFQADIVAAVPAETPVAQIVATLESIAADIQVEASVIQTG
ncbi:glycine cleavage system regulatory protein [Microbacterium sp. SORGH_AS428]|uniref:glycine cleavage system protein R n=1 Tax=Microbacterium sp. SORGH_AS_0428 TaxID=3041788 RepID=UPI00285BCC8F|nr:ACT domain-containing protein [Microbacterium sp. SORGH_AS_0428]MDR6198290.1 glycine cleavage system regulatory protein [Microbacterium sp. SORGH_AS_0428]